MFTYENHMFTYEFILDKFKSFAANAHLISSSQEALQIFIDVMTSEELLLFAVFLNHVETSIDVLRTESVNCAIVYTLYDNILWWSNTHQLKLAFQNTCGIDLTYPELQSLFTIATNMRP